MTQTPFPPSPDEQQPPDQPPAARPSYGPQAPGYSYQPPPGYAPQQYPPPGAGRLLPTIWPTLLVTLFFGIFGLIPAVMHTTRARDAGQPTSKYWITFGCVMVAAFLLWFLMFGILAASSTPTHTYYH